jgi:transposase
MIGIAMYHTITTLWKRGNSKLEICRQTGHSWKTVDKLIKRIESGEGLAGRKERVHALAEREEEIIRYIEEGLTAVRIHEKLVESGKEVSYGIVKAYVRGVKKKKGVYRRFHSEPGEEVQVDFTDVGKQPNLLGELKRAYGFCMTLGYSRFSYHEIVFDQSVDTFLRCHMNGFEALGGVPKVVKIDNLKAGVSRPSFYEPVIQEQYKQFAKHYHFDPIPCKVRRPEEKGKVESGVKYLKRNFFAGRVFKDNEDMNRQLRE